MPLASHQTEVTSRSIVTTTRQWVMLIAPIVLIITMIAVFRSFVALFGYPLGYLSSFLVYWIGWCDVLPLAVVSPRDVAALFAEVCSIGVPERSTASC
jgi:hypothetical protein